MRGEGGKRRWGWKGRRRKERWRNNRKGKEGMVIEDRKGERVE